jgi:hypothetical protein
MSMPNDYCVPFAARMAKHITNRDILGNAVVADWASHEAALKDRPLGLLVHGARRMREIAWPRWRGNGVPPLGSIGFFRALNDLPGHCVGCCVVANGRFAVRWDRGVAFLSHEKASAIFAPNTAG